MKKYFEQKKYYLHPIPPKSPPLCRGDLVSVGLMRIWGDMICVIFYFSFDSLAGEESIAEVAMLVLGI